MPSVLFVAPSAYTLSGLATWLDYLLPGLRKCGWDAQLGLVSGPRHHRPDRYLAVHPEEHVQVAHNSTGTREGRVRALDRLLDSVGADIAVSVNIPDLFGAIDRRRREARIAPRAVLSVHGIEAFLYADARRHQPILDAVICTNRLACELAVGLGRLDGDRILYAPYGVAVPASVPAREPSECLRIVFSGRLEAAQKRVADLVGIVAGLRARGVPFVLEIAGDGPERGKLEDALREDVAAGRVRFRGQLPIEVLKSGPYAQSDALLITSSWETGPIVAWEAMAQGLPVVSSRYVGSGREDALVDGRNSLLFDVGDTESAAAALARLWREPQLRSALAAGGRSLVEERYAIDVSVQHWNEVLLAVISRPARSAAPVVAAMPIAGRLDRLLGPALAESLREAVLRHAPLAPDPGGEWPHAHGAAPSDDAFWRTARAADAPQSAEPGARGVTHVD